ncbi:MAG: hypothetical protein HDR05_12450 [Lachnospiraceae bacterium]|nr:hypothetical protein [Lachnospiraceae bacterium]
MSKLIDIKTNTGNTIKVADIKSSHIQNIIKEAQKCTSIDAIILFGSSLEERCTEKSDIDIVIISKYTVNRLCDIKSYNKFMDSVYDFDLTQSYDKLYFHSIDEIYDDNNDELIFRELREKGKIIYQKEN